MGAATGGGAGYSMTNQGTSRSGDATTSVGGITNNLNLSSAGLNKGVPTWALAAGIAVLAYIGYKLIK